MEKEKILKEIAYYEAACNEILQSKDVDYEDIFYGYSNALHNLKEKLRILEEMEKVN